MKLQSGWVLHGVSEGEFPNSVSKFRRHLLWDKAMDNSMDRSISGAAAYRWFKEVGESPQSPGGTHHAVCQINNTVGVVHDLDVNQKYVERCLEKAVRDLVGSKGSSMASPNTDYREISEWWQHYFDSQPLLQQK